LGWSISIPYRSRTDSFAAVGALAREAIDDPEDREVMRELVLQAAATEHPPNHHHVVSERLSHVSTNVARIAS
jgi:hypothetical protein